jgi:hypothetical protein
MGNEITYYSKSCITVGSWYHVAVTIKEGNDVNFYINGASAGKFPQADIFGIVNNEPLRIGKIKSEDYWFSGAIDDVRIYNRALSAAEIRKIYQALNP